MAEVIVIGEDHEQMRRLIVDALTVDGYEIHEAGDTGAVLDQVAKASPAVLILDVHMPGEGGIAALRKIRADPALRGIRVLLLSGSVEALDADWATEVGADDHLPKPFQVAELREKVRALLAN